MDLRDSESERRFRSDLRAWLAEVVPSLPAKPDDDDWEGRRRYDTDWQRALFEAGYAGVDWPSDVGGRGASPAEQLIFLEETQAAGAPYVGVNFVGLLHAGPTIASEGTAEQKARYLPPVLRGDEVWCQGFSEPGAGSDLAALSTKAVRDGDHYVVNGQKIWTSFAHVADFCELLVRTDPGAPKHRGISWLILPMSTPGIEIRPLRTIAGSSEFSEVFLSEVRVPVENRVGEENDGWRVAMVTFSFERGTAFVVELAQTMALLRDLAALAKRVPRGEGTAWDDPGIRRELGHLLAEVDALWALTKRHVSQAASRSGPGFGVSVSKLRYSEVRHQMGDLALRILGRAAGSLDDMADLAVGEHLRGWLYAMSISIAAGSSQIQRNIVAERILGLPKEASA